MTEATLSLAQSIDAFADLTQHLTETDLDRPWAWNSYDEEGVRFAFFRVFEELRTLTVQLQQERQIAGRPPSSAQRILAQYHVAYRDLYAAMRGIDATTLDTPPAEAEWPVRQALGHIAGADAGFFTVLVNALTQLRAGVSEPVKMDLETYEAILGMKATDEDAALEGPLTGIVAFHEMIHGRILAELADISEDELALPSVYWESGPLSVRFRLHRFESHMRQHTVQIDKTLVALGHGPIEVRRLLRMIYGALAGTEGALIGAEEVGADLVSATANAIAGYTAEIAVVLGQ